MKMDKKEEKKEEDKSTTRRVLFPDKPSLIVPHFMLDSKNPSWMGNLLHYFNMFKKLEVNLPFADPSA